MMFDKIYEVSIDEAGQFDVDSDHVLMPLSFYSKTVMQANSNNCKPKSVWKINDTTKWDFLLIK